MSLLHLHRVKAKWLGYGWSTDHKGNSQREAHDKAESGPWSKVGEVPKSPLWTGNWQDWWVGGGQSRQSEVSVARLSGVKDAFKGSGLYLTVKT